MQIMYQMPRLISAKASLFCPGCSHGIVARLLAECIDKYQRETLILTSGGCTEHIGKYLSVPCRDVKEDLFQQAMAEKGKNEKRLVFAYETIENGSEFPLNLQGKCAISIVAVRNHILRDDAKSMCETAMGRSGMGYVCRCALDNPSHIREAKTCLNKVIECQLNNSGLSYIELVGICPQQMHMSAPEAMLQIASTFLTQYPRKEFEEHLEDCDDFY